jgi:hypothetical protein
MQGGERKIKNGIPKCESLFKIISERESLIRDLVKPLSPSFWISFFTLRF